MPIDSWCYDWLAHLFGEPGVDDITILFDDTKNEVSISVLSIPEVFGRLKLKELQGRWEEVREIYPELVSHVISIDDLVAHKAIQLRAAPIGWLLVIDGLIAATTLVRKFTLVHRVSHFGQYHLQTCCNCSCLISEDAPPSQ